MAQNIRIFNEFFIVTPFFFLNSFGSSIQKKVWKKLYEPGPGAYDIPSTIAGIPNYLLNNTMQNVKGSEESKYSEYIKEINQSIGPGESYHE